MKGRSFAKIKKKMPSFKKLRTIPTNDHLNFGKITFSYKRNNKILYTGDLIYYLQT